MSLISHLNVVNHSHKLVRSGDSCLQVQFWSHSIVGLMMWLLVVCGKNASHSFGFHWISKVEQNCTFVIWRICWTSEFIFCNPAPHPILGWNSYHIGRRDVGYCTILWYCCAQLQPWNPFLWRGFKLTPACPWLAEPETLLLCARNPKFYHKCHPILNKVLNIL